MGRGTMILVWMFTLMVGVTSAKVAHDVTATTKQVMVHPNLPSKSVGLSAASLLPELSKISKKVASSASEAERADAVAQNLPLMKAADKKFKAANDMMTHAELTTLRAARMKKAATHVLQRAIAAQKHADMMMSRADKHAVHERASALQDLRKAQQIEQRNQKDNLRVEAMQQSLAGMKYSNKASKARVGEMKALSMAKDKKLQDKVAALSKQLRSAKSQH